MATAFLYSCSKDVGQLTPSTSQTTQQQLPSVVSFSNDIVPIFNSSCNNNPVCHTASYHAGTLDLAPLSAYNSLFAKHQVDTLNPSGSNLVIVINNGSMPLPPNMSLTNYQQQLILKWIQQMAKNN